MEVSEEEVARVEPAGCDLLPGLPDQHLRVDFLLPEHRERSPLGVVVEARHSDEGGVVVPICRSDILEKILALSDADYSGRD
jgi:hypothetical protein